VEEVERKGGGEEGRRRRGEQEEEEGGENRGGEKRGGENRGGEGEGIGALYFTWMMWSKSPLYCSKRRFLTMNYLLSPIMLVGFRAITIPLSPLWYQDCSSFFS
jgi:hypothetical protein